MLFSPDKRNQPHAACTFLARNPGDRQSGFVQLAPDRVDLAIYLVGWMCGWFLLWRLRPLPTPRSDAAATTPAGSATSIRPGVAVVIPARNEAASLPHLLQPLVGQIGPSDELLVVDDHSDDDTAAIARRFGAQTVTPPSLPSGWLGKPHACARGAEATTAPILLFLDADVRPAADLLERVAAAVIEHPDAVVSMQPWHVTGSWAEQASVLCNVTALMGCGAFTPVGRTAAATVAFGPVLAVDRGTYERVGGHG
jgi:4,4'-diaponeurosporenoate glycosyltransferase